MPQTADAVAVLAVKLIFFTLSRRAILFIGIIATVIVTVTHPGTPDTLAVVTVEFQRGTCGQHAAIFITVVSTIIVSVTLPLCGDTGAFAKGTHGTGEVVPAARTLAGS